MNESYCKSKQDTSFGCKYCRKRFNQDGSGAYKGCYFLPYWGKPIEEIRKCPRFNANGAENPYTLRSVCHASR